jgi:hypothetical protein
MHVYVRVWRNKHVLLQLSGHTASACMEMGGIPPINLVRWVCSRHDCVCVAPTLARLGFYCLSRRNNRHSVRDQIGWHLGVGACIIVTERVSMYDTVTKTINYSLCTHISCRFGWYLRFHKGCRPSHCMQSVDAFAPVTAINAY